MVSIIIIGKNEGDKLRKCIKSVEKVLNTHKNNIKIEAIYVDSKSTDGSVDVARNSRNIRVYQNTGETNAAIARNIGARVAKGNILFFVDGDMEIESNFLDHVLTSKNELKYNFVTGHIKDYIYDYKGNNLDIKGRTYDKIIPANIENIKSCGGVFIISRALWESIGGMRTKYKRGQDLDFSMRLNEEGYTMIRYPELIVKHHTIEYKNIKRMWINLGQGYFLYPAMLLRDHFTNINMWKDFLRSKYTAIILFISILIFPIYSSVIFPLIIMTIYSFRSYMSITNTKIVTSKFLYFCSVFFYQIMYDIGYWFAIFSYFPTEKQVTYKEI
ncbi:MAG: glycosyltransferase family 2 protein [Bacteroidota bacterium]